jgi:hypothetical protein
MKLGIPVVTSDAGSLREIVGDSALLIDPRKPSQLADAMRQLASSQRLQEDLRCRGFVRAKGFSFEAELALLAEMFAKVKPTWVKRLRRRLALSWADSCVWSRAKATNVYRFFRSLVRTALSR